MYELHLIKELLAFLVTYSLNNDIIIMDDAKTKKDNVNG